jgi:Lrp/AsnC family transcriptional regulator for asnA, asnC and gidA
MTELDEINKDILRLLGEDSRYQYTQIQKELKKKGHNLSREAVEYRVKRMIDGGTIKKFAMITDPEKIGYQICVYLEISLADLGKRDEVGQWLAALPNTAYVHSATNLFDIATRIFFTDTKDLLSFLKKLEDDSRMEDFNYDIIRKTYKVGPIAPL